MTVTTPAVRGLLDPLDADLKVAQGALRRFVRDAGATSTAVRDDLRAGLRRLRLDAEIAESELEAMLAYDRRSYLAAVRRLLDGWRTGLDELRVQLQLARMDAGDEVRELLATGEEAWSAAARHLADSEADAEATLDVLRAGVDDSLRGGAAAVRAAAGVLRRHSGDGD